MKGGWRSIGWKAEKGIEKAEKVDGRQREGKMMEGGERDRGGGGRKAWRRERSEGGGGGEAEEQYLV